MHVDEIRRGLGSRVTLTVLSAALAAPFLVIAASLRDSARIIAVGIGLWVLGICALNIAHLIAASIRRVADGFLVRSLPFDGGTYFRWADIGPLRVAGVGPISRVEFEGVPSRQSRLWALGSVFRRGSRGAAKPLQYLPARPFGRTPSALLDTLNEWRDGKHGV